MAGDHKLLRQEDSNGGGVATLTGIGAEAFLGQITEALGGAERAEHKRLIGKVWPLPLTPVVLSAPGTVDNRDIYGPKDGLAWDLRFTQLTATGGTLDLYLNQPTTGGASDPGNLVHIAAAGASQIQWSSGVIVLQPGDRFVVVAGASTTAAACIIRVVQVPLPVLGEYLM
jgi:hypothetical protein